MEIVRVLLYIITLIIVNTAFIFCCQSLLYLSEIAPRYCCGPQCCSYLSQFVSNFSHSLPSVNCRLRQPRNALIISAQTRGLHELYQQLGQKVSTQSSGSMACFSSIHWIPLLSDPCNGNQVSCCFIIHIYHRQTNPGMGKL